MPLRLIFMGTPDFAVPTLIELAARGHEIAAVYTRAPKPAGRGMDMQVTPGEREARRLGVPGHTPKTLGDAAAPMAVSGDADGFSRHACRCRGARRLWADPAETGPGGAPARLLQRPCVTVAPLARRR